MVKDKPIFLNVFQIRFPITAWVSILHRLSGITLFLFIPLLLWMLQESLTSETQFNNLIQILRQPVLRFGVWIAIAALIYHWVAGIRHLLMDLHIGESKVMGKLSAWIVLAISMGSIGVFIVMYCLC